MFAQNPGTGFTIWITGMQGAGKSALAREIFNRLKRLEKPAELLEGPDWDVFIGKGPGNTKDERNAIMRRAGFVARALTRAGGFVLVPQVSPIRETREALRREIGRFVEVFVDCPFDALLSRDTTGQYKKAISGEIPNFIGVTDPYEPPANPEVKYDSSKSSIDDAATLVMQALVREGVLTPADIGLSKVPPAPEEKEKKGKKPPEPILFSPELLTLPKTKPSDAKAGAKAAAATKAPEKVLPAKVGKATPAKPEAKPSKAEAKPSKAAKPEKAAKPTKPAKAAKPEKAAARRREEPARAAKKKEPQRARKAAPAKKAAAKTARAAKPAKKAAAKKPEKKAKKSKR